jgi:ABC-2 type transport system permease protein
MPDVLGVVSDLLPLSYAVDAMSHLTTSSSTREVWGDLAVVAGFVVAGLALGAATLRRRTG